MGEVAGLVGTRVLTAHNFQRQTEMADVRKAEIQRENEARRDKPKDDHRNVKTGNIERKKYDVGDDARNRRDCLVNVSVKVHGRNQTVGSRGVLSATRFSRSS